eukprot:2406538-Pyramimonas_sp.AAC.1
MAVLPAALGCAPRVHSQVSAALGCAASVVKGHRDWGADRSSHPSGSLWPRISLPSGPADAKIARGLPALATATVISPRLPGRHDVVHRLVAN